MTLDPRLLAAVQSYTDRLGGERLSHVRWLPGQEQFFRADARHPRLFRAGNQSVGKTYAMLADMIWHCLGQHPYRPTRHEPPVEAWLLCAEWAQSINIQAKLWDLCPKWAVADGCHFDPVKGFGFHAPALRFRNGSLIRVKTTKQSALSMAGATISYVGFDEPPHKPGIYSEVAKRVQRSAGYVALAMTPINAPVDWIREECGRGTIQDLHVPLSPEAMIPVGYTEPLRLEDGTPCDQAWIDEITHQCLPWEVPVRIHGEWEMRLAGRAFEAYRPDLHISERSGKGAWKWHLGIDLGTGVGRNAVALLVAVDDSGPHPRYYVADEAISDTRSTSEEDVRRILAMLKRRGVAWGQLERVFCDISVPGPGRIHMKSAANLATEYRRLAGRNPDPPIRTVKRNRQGRGGVIIGIRELHQAMLRDGGFAVHPRCERVIASLDRYTMADDEWKHAIDALRYALEHHIFFSGRRAAPVEARVWG